MLAAELMTVTQEMNKLRLALRTCGGWSQRKRERERESRSLLGGWCPRSAVTGIWGQAGLTGHLKPGSTLEQKPWSGCLSSRFQPCAHLMDDMGPVLSLLWVLIATSEN